jgi:mono/diheme cytochrome c family protein/rhodanese-related sulfurtransferase
VIALLTAAALAHGPPPDPVRAQELYQRYCALCHGEDRQGHAADHAPSLRAPELWATASPAYLWQAVAWGRPGTAMSAFSQTQGGPLDHDSLHILMGWLKTEAGVEAQTLSDQPVSGDEALGAQLFAEHCASCHGPEGQGGAGNALGNPVFLATASDAYIREGIRRGRAGTPMVAWRELLSEPQIDAITAFLRSRATGWSAPEPVRVAPPSLDKAILNPQAPPARLSVREERFVPVDEVAAALVRGERMVLLDARPLSDWQSAHLPGALPMPFYDGVEALVPHLPRNETPIIAYCACPHAASGKVVDALRARGFSRAVVLDEGVLVWAARGYPISIGGAP